MTTLTVDPKKRWYRPFIEFRKGFVMKSIIAATLILFSVSTSALAFEMPNIDGIDGIQQLSQSKLGKRSQQRAQQSEDGQEQQQQSRRGGLQGMMKGLMNGDTSGLQGIMSSLGQ